MIASRLGESLHWPQPHCTQLSRFRRAASGPRRLRGLAQAVVGGSQARASDWRRSRFKKKHADDWQDGVHKITNLEHTPYGPLPWQAGTH
eukprot:747314-Hanusia_phi.AAC.16